MRVRLLAAVYLTCVLCAGCAAATPPSPADGVAPNLDATVNARVSATLAAIPPTATPIPPAPTSKPTVAPSATSTAVPSPTSIPVPTATAVPAGPSDAEKTRAIRDAFTRVKASRIALVFSASLGPAGTAVAVGTGMDVGEGTAVLVADGATVGLDVGAGGIGVAVGGMAARVALTRAFTVASRLGATPSAGDGGVAAAHPAQSTHVKYTAASKRTLIWVVGQFERHES